MAGSDPLTIPFGPASGMSMRPPAFSTLIASRTHCVKRAFAGLPIRLPRERGFIAMHIPTTYPRLAYNVPPNRHTACSALAWLAWLACLTALFLAIDSDRLSRSSFTLARMTLWCAACSDVRFAIFASFSTLSATVLRGFGATVRGSRDGLAESDIHSNSLSLFFTTCHARV